MDINTLLLNQTKDAYSWASKLINAIPEDKWEVIPDVVHSCISWQAGHLIMSYYYHSIMCISGHSGIIRDSLPLKEYSGLYNFSNPSNSAGKVSPDILKKHLSLVSEVSLQTLTGLKQEEFLSPLEPTQMPHPVAKTKLEALDWNNKHTMWHCGQISMLSRAIGVPYDFGIKINNN